MRHSGSSRTIASPPDLTARSSNITKNGAKINKKHKNKV
jgi:hypothetical protein